MVVCGKKVRRSFMWKWGLNKPTRQRTETYLVRTMETASLRILSPNTSMLRTGSTLRALKMAMVATGSTAEISEPKAKLEQVRTDRETE